MLRATWMLWLGLTACDRSTVGLDVTEDADGDGFAVLQDCDDGDDAVHPGAPELCNGLDDDCDGAVDQGAVDAPTWYVDVDGDGAAGTPLPVVACDAPEGASEASTDCADLDNLRFPGAPERCNGLDDDCDGGLDEDAGDLQDFYADVDGDGFGDPDAVTAACAAPPDHSEKPGDCADNDETVYPGAGERCGTVDEDCDGLVDQDDPDLDLGTGTRYFLDRDADGFGTSLFPVFACALPEGAALAAGDCDDLTDRVNPDATEVCNERDDDCDGLVDDADDDRDATTGRTFYADADGDGFGTASDTRRSCEAPEGFAEDNADCDDTSDAVRPGAREVCNGRDDDCDSRVDDDDPTLDVATATRFWADRDGDGHGGRWFSLVACAQPDGLASAGDDCNDDDAAVSPSAPEVCDGGDNDCDGLVDDADPNRDETTGSPWHPDGDGDGWGASDVTAWACVAPEGYGQDTSDCDDDDPDRSPGVDEVCNGADDDCDGAVDDLDDSLTSEGATYWRDADGDGWGTPADWACEDFGFGWASTQGDCDDSRPDVKPQAAEACDGRDNDCDGATDEDAADAELFYTDGDRDGWGGSGTVRACFRPSGAADRDGDCLDSRSDVNPDANEVCDNVDNDCDGTVDVDTPGLPRWYVDADGDTWGADNTGIPACRAFEGRVSRDGDCADEVPSVNPGAAEVDGDDVDNDCDGRADFPTVVPGRVITTNTTWGEDESLFEVEGNILVAQGVTLTIAPCTQILFAPGRSLQVEGTLIARGRADCPITFSSSAEEPQPGDWARVIFTTTSQGATLDSSFEYVSGSILEHVEILFAGSISPALVIEGSPAGPILRNVRVAHSANHGMYSARRVTVVDGCTFEDNGQSGMELHSAHIVRNSQFLRNQQTGAVLNFSGGAGELLSDNTFRDNGRSGLELRNSSDLDVLGNWFVDNGDAGMETDGYRGDVIGNFATGNRTGFELTSRDGGRFEGNWAVENGLGWSIRGDSFNSNPPRFDVIENVSIGNTSGTTIGGFDGAWATGNLFQENPPGGVALRLSLHPSYRGSIAIEGNAWVGAQATPWFDVGLASGSPFVDVTDNYWNGRVEPGAAINDFLVDPARTVALFAPVLTALPTGVPVSRPAGLDASRSGAVVTLTWDANPEADLAGYRVYYGLEGDDPWALDRTGAVEGASGFEVLAETATLTGLDPALPWRFAVAAIDVDADGLDDLREGHESWPSAVATP